MVLIIGVGHDAEEKRCHEKRHFPQTSVAGRARLAPSIKKPLTCNTNIQYVLLASPIRRIEMFILIGNTHDDRHAQPKCCRIRERTRTHPMRTNITKPRADPTDDSIAADLASGHSETANVTSTTTNQDASTSPPTHPGVERAGGPVSNVLSFNPLPHQCSEP